MTKGTELTGPDLMFIIHLKDTHIKQARSINGLLAWFIPLENKRGMCR